MHKKTKLDIEHYRLLLDLRNGADVIGYGEAMRCREIQRAHPSWIDITDLMGDYDGAGRLPYFGAIATKEGIKVAKKRLGLTVQKKNKKAA